MNKNDTLRNLLISGAVFVLFVTLLQSILPSKSAVPPMGSDARPAETVAPSIAGATPQAGLVPRESDSSGFQIIEADQEIVRSLGADQYADSQDSVSPYRVRLLLTNVEAAIESAQLTDHAAALGGDERYTMLSSIERSGGRKFRSFAVEQINLDGQSISLLERKWTVYDDVESADETEADRLSFALELTKNSKPVLRLVRTFILPAQSVDSKRHDLQVVLSVENLDVQVHNVILTFRGGVGMPREDTRVDDRYVDHGISDGTRVSGARKTVSQVSGKATVPFRLFAPSVDTPGNRLSWIATGNKYFTCTLAPLSADRKSPSNDFAQATAVDLDQDSTTSDDVTVRLTSRQVNLAPGRRVVFPVDVYLGEKDGKAFGKIEPYLSRNYYFQVETGYGMCTFTWLVELMIYLLNGLYAAADSIGLGDFGLAIIILVLMVRTLLHPITKKGQVNMVRMQQGMADLAPKMEEIKRKYSNDKARQQQETMKLYREGGINPAANILGCLPMFLQMPIWVALYLSLNNNILMRHQETFIVPWVRDLTTPDALYTFGSPFIIPLLGWEIAGLNLLPIFVAIFMYTQQKLQPKPEPNPNMTEQQRAQQDMMQKMMPMMSIMMLVIFYNMPSGLNLYIMASSMFGTIEQHRIRKHIKEQKEAGTLLAPRRKKDEPTSSEGLKKPRRGGIFQKLQKMAEDAQKAQPKRAPKGKRSR